MGIELVPEMLFVSNAPHRTIGAQHNICVTNIPLFQMEAISLGFIDIYIYIVS
jgi:hypothetical protein